MVQKLRSKLNGKDESGFTLIELMIVVAIIGILAAIAIPNFTRFQLKAKSSEGKVNVAAIRTAQEAYSAEFGTFVAATASPAAPGGTVKAPFVDASGGFDQLGWAPEGDVYFSYETNRSAGAWFNIGAEADIDGTTQPAAAATAGNQQWGYFSNSSAAASANGCTQVVNGATGPLYSVVGPCDTTSGQSKF